MYFMSVTWDTSHSLIGPYLDLEHSPTGDSSRQLSTASLSSSLDFGENTVVVCVCVCVCEVDAFVKMRAGPDRFSFVLQKLFYVIAYRTLSVCPPVLIYSIE